MRYSMLVTITNMAKTLLEAAQYLASAPAGDMRAELLDNGRRMIGQIKNVLEQHSGDLHTTLPLERLWKIEQLWGGEDNAALEATLTELIRKMPEEISYQVRAVFFAELGEKWDAMESVYEYMRDDPRFDPVVVRTPVGRVVTRDGKREQEIIYRDFLTPMGIPSLGYDQYSLEEDCPELAFISQPYESCTLREFWPETIAKVTRLVYLPYWIPDLISENTQEALCQMPVYQYAWKVIGSSQSHYRYYAKHTPSGGGNMLVTGLPKADPVVHLRESGTNIPDSWKPVIDGRKVILWNTWYNYEASSLKFFDKITEWFCRHNDCALIWRPHPMTETVTKLYYPKETFNRIHDCIAKVEGSNNMLIDAAPAYKASFWCSQAQISDFSSLMFQYLLMDKPVLWISRPNDQSRKENKKFFIDWHWMEETSDVDGVLRFLEHIRVGSDQKRALRDDIRRRDLPLADGHCGERVGEELWKCLHREDNVVMIKEEESLWKSIACMEKK